MSDDEDFYDEYDEDIFWVEEPDPTVAVRLHPLFSSTSSTSVAPQSLQMTPN